VALVASNTVVVKHQLATKPHTAACSVPHSWMEGEDQKAKSEKTCGLR